MPYICSPVEQPGSIARACTQSHLFNKTHNPVKNSDNALRIAVQKSGRLSEKTLKLLENIGLDFNGFKNRLLVPSENFDVELLLIRDDDIPEYVQDGVCELGFVGGNVRAEKQAGVEVLRDLKYGGCRLSVAVPRHASIDSVEQLANARIATSYPNLTREFFEKKNVPVHIVDISGAVEIAPALDVADAISDLVSSGGTLKANNLIELETIMHSECELIRTRMELSGFKQQLIDKFLQRIEGRQTAERSRYIMMNVPRESLDEVCEIIPALKSPTVLPLAEEHMVAVHSVIPHETFWEVMEDLKEAGATGIVVLPIENMIP